MTRDERGKVLTVPVSLAGLTALWAAAVLLLGWSTMADGPWVAAAWGLMASAGAAAWTVLYGLAQHCDQVIRAFDLGREVGSQTSSVRPLR